jgi:hypothetical protein
MFGQWLARRSAVLSPMPTTAGAAQETAIMEPTARIRIIPKEAMKGTRKTLYPATQAKQAKAEVRGDRATVKPIYDATPFPPLN